MDTINEEIRSEIEQIASGKLSTKDHLSSVVTRQRERLMQLLYAPMQRIAALTSQTTHASEQSLANADQLSQWATDIPEMTWFLAERLWPSPFARS